MIFTSRKRGQAALEFLTTYGWAFLVILVVIGALSYFGVLNPSKYLPEKCDFGNNIGCDRNRVLVQSDDTTSIKLGLQNNLGSSVQLVKAYANSSNPLITASTETAGSIWHAGDYQTVTIGLTGMIDLPVGQKEAFEVTVEYYDIKAGADFTKKVVGELYQAVAVK